MLNEFSFVVDQSRPTFLLHFHFVQLTMNAIGLAFFCPSLMKWQGIKHTKMLTLGVLMICMCWYVCVFHNFLFFIIIFFIIFHNFCPFFFNEIQPSMAEIKTHEKNKQLDFRAFSNSVPTSVEWTQTNRQFGFRVFSDSSDTSVNEIGKKVTIGRLPTWCFTTSLHFFFTNLRNTFYSPWYMCMTFPGWLGVKHQVFIGILQRDGICFSFLCVPP